MVYVAERLEQLELREVINSPWDAGLVFFVVIRVLFEDDLCDDYYV